jgi:hypothetical protein
MTGYIEMNKLSSNQEVEKAIARPAVRILEPFIQLFFDSIKNPLLTKNIKSQFHFK